MDILLNDLASWTYAYNILVSFYGFIIFLYWAIKKGGASIWYVYIMVLLLSMVISQSVMLSARYLLLADSEFHEILLSHPAWAAKSWLSSLAITAICVHASWRLWRYKKHGTDM